MIEYKEPSAISNHQTAFRIASEFGGPFDPRSSEAITKFAAWAAISSDDGPSKFRDALHWLHASGLVADPGGPLCQLTTKGHTWARVFTLRHDGAFMVF